MPKSTSYSELQNPWIEYRFNQPETDSEGVTKYRPLTMTARGQATTTDGGRRDVMQTLTAGNLSTTPLTNKQIYDQLGGYTVMHTHVRNLLAALYNEAISADISVA